MHDLCICTDELYMYIEPIFTDYLQGTFCETSIVGKQHCFELGKIIKKSHCRNSQIRFTGG